MCVRDIHEEGITDQWRVRRSFRGIIGVAVWHGVFSVNSVLSQVTTVFPVNEQSSQ